MAELLDMKAIELNCPINLAGWVKENDIFVSYLAVTCGSRIV